MRVGVDARPLISGKSSGIGNYLFQILDHLQEDGQNEYFLYTTRPLACKGKFLDTMTVRIGPGHAVGTLWICYGLKRQLKHDRIEVFWGTEHMLPLNTPHIKKVVTVHDLALLINPRWGSWRNALMQNVFTRKSCKIADRVIAISEATKRDVRNLLSIADGRITTILSGGGVYRAGNTL